MKKFILIVLAAFFTLVSNAQNWLTTGNSNLNSSSFIGSTNFNNLEFRTNNAQRFKIKADGGVGVGDLSDSEIDAFSGSNSAGSLTLKGSSGTSLNLINRFNSPYAAQIRMYGGLENGFAAGIRHNIIDAGFLIIQPGAESKTGAEKLLKIDGRTHIGQGISDPSNLGRLIVDNSGVLGHYVSGSFGDVFGSSQWIGIGSSPNNAYGFRAQSGSSALTLNLQGGNTELQWGTSGNLNFNFLTSPTSAVQRLQIQSGGLVQIGQGAFSSQDGVARLSVQGISFGQSFISVSDGSLKEDIKVIPNSASIIKKLRGTTYFWKSQSKEEQKGKEYGCIAQEVQKVIPEAVVMSPEGKLGVNYNFFIPVLIEAMKEELEAKEKLQSRVTDLETRLQKLEKMLGETTVQNQSIDKTTSKSKAISFQCSPNPTSGKVLLNYQLKGSIDGEVIMLSDLSGKVLFKINLNATSGAVELPTEALPSGIYIYSLTKGSDLLESKKLVINK